MHLLKCPIGKRARNVNVNATILYNYEEMGFCFVGGVRNRDKKCKYWDRICLTTIVNVFSESFEFDDNL